MEAPRQQSGLPGQIQPLARCLGETPPMMPCGNISYLAPWRCGLTFPPRNSSSAPPSSAKRGAGLTKQPWEMQTERESGGLAVKFITHQRALPQCSGLTTGETGPLPPPKSRGDASPRDGGIREAPSLALGVAVWWQENPEGPL